MTRKTRTVATLEVRLDIPVGGNISTFTDLVRNATNEQLLRQQTDTADWSNSVDSLVVKLVKKETNYA